MKKKFKMMMFYFKSAKIQEVPFEFETDSNGYVGAIDFDTNISVTGVIEDILQDIMEMYVEKCIEQGEDNIEYDNTSDYYRIYGTIDVKNEKIIFENLSYTYYDTEGSGNHYDIGDYEEGEPMYDTFMEVGKFLEEIGSDLVTIRYNGGGDSGYIESEYETPNGTTGSVSEDMEDICYKLLQEFGGWEINEGSQGEITFTKGAIVVEHEWNVEENDSTSLDIIVTENSFSE